MENVLYIRWLGHKRPSPQRMAHLLEDIEAVIKKGLQAKPSEWKGLSLRSGREVNSRPEFPKGALGGVYTNS